MPKSNKQVARFLRTQQDGYKLKTRTPRDVASELLVGRLEMSRVSC